MKIEAERALWDAIKVGRWARDVIHDMIAAGTIVSEKQAHATLEKWSHEGCYDYGVALDLGWCDHGGKTPKRLS